MRTATNARRTPNEKNILTSEVTAAANKWKRSTKETPWGTRRSRYCWVNQIKGS